MLYNALKKAATSTPLSVVCLPQRASESVPGSFVEQQALRPQRWLPKNARKLGRGVSDSTLPKSKDRLD